nr:hypothetical protein KPHV_87100 [Kitasatospora purpeofusca]
MFQVPAVPEGPARYGTLIAEAGSELWLWTARPTTLDELRTPEQVLRLAADGAVTVLTGARAAARRRRADPKSDAERPTRRFGPWRARAGGGRGGSRTAGTDCCPPALGPREAVARGQEGERATAGRLHPADRAA